jgi:hypothetical protein
MQRAAFGDRLSSPGLEPMMRLNQVLGSKSFLSGTPELGQPGGKQRMQVTEMVPFVARRTQGKPQPRETGHLTNCYTRHHARWNDLRTSASARVNPEEGLHIA